MDKKTKTKTKTTLQFCFAQLALTWAVILSRGFCPRFVPSSLS